MIIGIGKETKSSTIQSVHMDRVEKDALCTDQQRYTHTHLSNTNQRPVVQEQKGLSSLPSTCITNSLSPLIFPLSTLSTLLTTFDALA